MSSTGHKASRYIVFPTPLLPQSSLVQTPRLTIRYTTDEAVHPYILQHLQQNTDTHTYAQQMCFITFHMICHMDNEGMNTFLGPCEVAGHPASQAVIQSPASHCTGLDSIPDQSLRNLWGTEFHCNIFLSKYFIFPVSITPPLLHSHSCIYHQCNVTSAQHNFLVNTAVGQTLLQSFLQHSP